MKISKEFKIGFFAIAVLVVSFFLINYLRGEDIFNKEIEVSARFGKVEGLVPSAPVFIKGYKALCLSRSTIIYTGRQNIFRSIFQRNIQNR